jgi:hypothetical protein
MDAEERIVATYPTGGHGFPLDEREVAYRFIDRAMGMNQSIH